jgi:CheY-like chemotaxis protein
MTESKSDLSVLCVEDDEETREELVEYLRRRVRVVVSAGDGVEGLRLYQERCPDLVVTDLRMPRMDGLQMLEAISALGRQTPVIVTTAHGETEYLIRAIELGVDRLLIKPVDGDKLAQALYRCVDLITFRRATRAYEEERERLVLELQQALANVKSLSGLIPICAWCKKIRDDAGYWQRLETYLSAHSRAQLSHGICPDCLEREVHSEG